jgi:DNA-binding response OmpR family regulator
MAKAEIHILLVEDDPTLAQFFRDVLEVSGCPVSHAVNGRTGLEI